MIGNFYLLTKNQYGDWNGIYEIDCPEDTKVEDLWKVLLAGHINIDNGITDKKLEEYKESHQYYMCDFKPPIEFNRVDRWSPTETDIKRYRSIPFLATKGVFY